MLLSCQNSLITLSGEGSQKLRDTGILEWIHHVRSTQPNWEGGGRCQAQWNVLFAVTGRNKCVREAPASLKSCVVTPCTSEITVETAATKLGPLNTVGIIGYQGGRSHVATLNHQRQGGCGQQIGQWSRSNNQNSLAHRDRWEQLH